MSNFKTFLTELHLYSGKVEYLIKVLIWIICWIGGIFVSRNDTDSAGSTYFVFSLALLMEFAPSINGKRCFFARAIRSIFCFALGTILVLSIFVLFSTDYNTTFHMIMFYISIGIMGYMILDCLILWLSNDVDDDDLEIHKRPDEPTKIEIDKFMDSLYKGNLGNVDNELNHNV